MNNPFLLPRTVELLKQWSDYIVSDEAITDDFLQEGMTFQEALDLMDHVSKAVKEYIMEHTP